MILVNNNSEDYLLHVNHSGAFHRYPVPPKGHQSGSDTAQNTVHIVDRLQTEANAVSTIYSNNLRASNASFLIIWLINKTGTLFSAYFRIAALHSDLGDAARDDSTISVNSLDRVDNPSNPAARFGPAQYLFRFVSR